MSSEYKGKQKQKELPDDKSMEIFFLFALYLLFQGDSFIIAIFYVTCSWNGSSLCEQQRPERKNYPVSQFSGVGTLSLRRLITILCDNIETNFIYTSMTFITQNKLPLYVNFYLFHKGLSLALKFRNDISQCSVKKLAC